METKRKVLDKRFSLLLGAQLLILFVLVLGFTRDTESGSAAEQLRGMAKKLQAAGLAGKAAELYAAYLKSTDLKPKERASIAYSVAQLFEENGDYEAALAWFYAVEVADPKSENVSDASKRIVSLLEKMGKVAAAKRELKVSTSLGETSEKLKGSPMVAKVGSTTIYEYQINEAIDQLPESMRKTFLNKEGKTNFLKKYVADEVLYQKALRLQYNSKPDFKKRLKTVERQLLVERVIQDEVQDKVKVDQTDVKNYFEANREKFVKKASVAVSLIKVKSKAKANQVVKSLKKGASFSDQARLNSEDESTKANGGKVPNLVYRGEKFMELPNNAIATLFKTGRGKWTKPLLSSGYYYIFKVRSKNPEQRPKFEAIEDSVRMAYRMEKSQKLYQQLIEQSTQGETVQLFAENLK